MMTIDLTEIEQTLVSLAATALAIVGAAGLAALQKRFAILNSAAVTAAWDDALQKSITIGATKAEALIKEKGYDHLDVKNEVLNAALGIMVEKFPSTIASMGLSPTTAQATIAGALERAFPAAMAAYAASPVTPPDGFH